ncbi:MAG: hypothetical protein WCJ33_08255 [Pseudomonadota bacterium]
MYSILNHTHSSLRWVVSILAIYTIYKYYIGWKNKSAFAKEDNRLGALYVGSLHLQLVIGLLLYFVYSPIVQAAMSNMKLAMKDSALRFWAVEHITMMILAVIVAQVGRIVSKKSSSDSEKYRKGFVYFLISIIIILLAIPWPFRVEGIARGWFPGM